MNCRFKLERLRRCKPDPFDEGLTLIKSENFHFPHKGDTVYED